MPSERLNEIPVLVYHVRLVDSGFVPVTMAIRSLRLAVQDAALSRRKHEFDSRREHHYLSTTYVMISTAQ